MIILDLSLWTLHFSLTSATKVEWQCSPCLNLYLTGPSQVFYIDLAANWKRFDSMISFTEVDPCLSEPCVNGGYCSRRGDMTGYVCTCYDGYTGNTCETAPPPTTMQPPTTPSQPTTPPPATTPPPPITPSQPTTPPVVTPTLGEKKTHRPLSLF